MTFQILLMNEEIMSSELDFLLRFPLQPHVTSPVDFLSNSSWGGICSLSAKDEFRAFIEEKLGAKYVEARTVEFSKSFEEASPSTPIFFILSPGVNPLKDVEDLGKKLGVTLGNGNFHNVSLGQGQEVVAEQAMDTAAGQGHWVVLQKWLPALEKKLEHYSQGSHPDYRVFMSAEPTGTPATHIIPQGILESSIKITNEPPTGMQANLHKALDNFNQEALEMCSKEAEFKAILFSLCYFHAVVAEHKVWTSRIE